MTMMAMKMVNMMKWWGDNEDKILIVCPPGSLTCHQHSCRSGRALQLEPRPAPMHVVDLKIQNPPGDLVRGCCSLNSSHRWLCKYVCFMVVSISIIMVMLIISISIMVIKRRTRTILTHGASGQEDPLWCGFTGGFSPHLGRETGIAFNILFEWKGFITHKRSFAPCHPRYSWSEIPLKSKYCLGVLVSRLQ